jgi:hypothetical protein
MIQKDFTVKLKNCYVYVHVIKRSSEVFYVGKGTNHRWSATNRSKEWFNKCNGEEVNCRIIANNLTDHEAFLLEKKLISIIGRDFLVNLTDGGEGCNGAKVSEDTRAKLSKINSLNSFDRTVHLRKKIIMNNSICFNGVREAAKYIGTTSHNHISRVANGKSLSYKGNVFRWITTSELEFTQMQKLIRDLSTDKIIKGAIKARSLSPKTSVCMDDSISFRTVKDASEYMVDLGLAKNIISAKSTINAVLRNEIKLAFGFQWTKINVENKG